MDQDSELLDASRHTVDAFAVLYDRNYRSVLGYFYRRTGCPETFAAAFSSRQNFRPTGAPGSAWLFKIASRQLARYHRTNAVASRARHRLGMQNTTPSGEDLERIGCSEGAARVRVSRALSQLAAGLPSDGSHDTTTAAPRGRRPR